MKESVGLLLNRVGSLVTENAKKAELLNAFCPSVFTDKANPWESLMETREKEWWKEDFCFIKEDWVRDHLGNFDIYKSMCHDGMHQ